MKTAVFGVVLLVVAVLGAGCVAVPVGGYPVAYPPPPPYPMCQYPYHPVWMGGYWGCQLPPVYAPVPWYPYPPAGFNFWFFWRR